MIELPPEEFRTLVEAITRLKTQLREMHRLNKELSASNARLTIKVRDLNREIRKADTLPTSDFWGVVYVAAIVSVLALLALAGKS